MAYSSERVFSSLLFPTAVSCHSRSTINVSLTSGGNPSKLKFKPGDHLAVYPRNRQEIVNAIRRRLIRCPEGPVELQVMRKVTTPLGMSRAQDSQRARTMILVDFRFLLANTDALFSKFQPYMNFKVVLAVNFSYIKS